MNQDNTSSKQGYGRRPLWQWVLIYLIIGGAIYAAIYYFTAGRSGNSYGASTKTSTQAVAPAQSPQAAPAQTQRQQPSGGYNW